MVPLSQPEPVIGFRMVQSPSDPIAAAQRLIEQGQEASALDTLRNLLGAAPALGGRWGLVLQLCEQLGDEDAAAEAARQLGALAPDDPQRALVYADKLARIGKAEQARSITQRLVANRPNDPAAAYFHGVQLARAGEFESAEEHLRRSLALKPDLADAWVQLSAFLNFAEHPGDVDALRRLSENSAQAVQIPANFALGSAYHDLGEFAVAFAAWTRANKLLSPNRPFSKESLSQYTETAKRVAGEMGNPEPGFDSGDIAPVFIVGAPRTGTTLTEHILSSHPDVYPLGESLISRVATWPLRHLSPSDIAASKARYGSALWEMVGKIYVSLAQQRSGGSKFTTDKAAMLHIWVGVLAKALPNARFIWVHRTHEAAALSAFRTYFTTGNGWSCHLTDALAYYRAHDELMSDWAGLLGNKLFTLSYEALAKDPDQVIPELTGFVGLSADSGPMAPHLSRRSVDSASLAQVRRPITPASIEAWRKYEPYFPARD